jgi:hypothetical protein
MPKATLTREQVEAINHWLTNYAGGKESLIKHHIADGKWVDGTEALNGMPLDMLISALYVGYEIEKSPEEKLADYYKQALTNFRLASDWEEKEKYRWELFGINATLDILGINLKGVNCECVEI